jgi:hypothetical protein
MTDQQESAVLSPSGKVYRYILNANNEPVPEPDVGKWAQWWERNRVVAYDIIMPRKKRLRDWFTRHNPIAISTVFLGLDHDLTGEGPLVLWETMVFGGKLDGTQQRYTTLHVAMEGHRTIRMRVRNLEE